MASIVNSTANNSGIFTGQWEDVQKYSSVRITRSVGTVNPSGIITLQWDNPLNGNLPNSTTPFYTRTFPFTKIKETIECDHYGRWFRLICNASSITTMHKTVPSTIKITDGNNTVSVKAGLSTLLTDISGNALGTTDIEGNALYVIFTDASGQPLETNNQSSSVALSDGSGNNITSLQNLGGGVVNNAILCNNISDAGIPQASTVNVSGSYTNGKSLYLATECNSTYNVPSVSLDAIAVCLTNAMGTQESAFYVTATKILPTLNSFDISHGMTTDATLCVSRSCTLYDLYCYNDGPVVSWVLLYDTNDINNINTLAPTLSIPVLREDFHDIVLPRGCAFANGICIRASKTPDYTSPVNPGLNVIFVSGTYF